MVRPKVNKLLTAIAILAFLAMGVTAYLTYLHFEPEASEFCNFGESFNCGIVNKSLWSYVEVGSLEIPVAVMGFVTYLVFFVMSILLLKKVNFRKLHPKLSEVIVLNLLRYLSVVGFVFSLYLTYVEAFILQTWCSFCVTQQIIILIIMILFFVINGIVKAANSKGKICEFC